jgi:hypothetical protein
MADRTPRWLWENFCTRSDTIQEALSEDTAKPKANIRDELPSRVARSLAGYTVKPRFNASIDFQEGVLTRVAFIANGNFATPALYAAAVQTAVNAAGCSPIEYTPTAWWRAEDLLGAHGSNFGSWPDASGNGNGLGQISGSLRPTLFLRGINERPCMRFDGTGRRMVTSVNLSSLLGASGVGTVFVVFWVDADATLSDQLWSAGSTGLKVVAGPNLRADNLDAGGLDSASKAATLGAWHVGIWMHDGSTVFCGVDNGDTSALASTASAATTAGELATPLTIGTTSAAADALKGYIAEIVVCNTALSETDRRRLMAYFKQKFSGAYVDGSTAPTFNNTYTMIHDGSKHTLTRTAGADSVSLLWLTGKHVLETAGPDLGFVVTADDTGNTVYIADNVSLQSRQMFLFRLPAAAAAQCAYLLRHNLGSGGTVTVKGSDSRDGWYSSGFSQVLTGDDLTRIRIGFFSALQSFQNWAVIIDNVSGVDLYTDAGVIFIGPYDQPGRGYKQGKIQSAVPLSSYQRSEGGAAFGRPRNSPLTQHFTFHRLTRADMESYQEMEAATAGHHLAIALDPENYPGKRTHYGIIPAKAQIQEQVGGAAPGVVGADRYNIEVMLEEDLG